MPFSPTSAVSIDRPECRKAAGAGLTALVLLSLGHLFIDLYSSALGALQPLLVDKLGLTLTQAGIVGGVMVFSSSVMQPVYGLLSDRYRTKLFAALSPAISGVFVSALGLAPTYGWLLAMAVSGRNRNRSVPPAGLVTRHRRAAG